MQLSKPRQFVVPFARPAYKGEQPDLRTPMSQEIVSLELQVMELNARIEFLRLLEDHLRRQELERVFG